LYNSLGAVIKNIANTNFATTEHQLKIDVSNLPKGSYFVHYQTKGISKTKKLLKY